MRAVRWMGRIHRGGLVGLTWQPPSPTFCRQCPSLTPLAPWPPRRSPIGQRLQQCPRPGERPIFLSPPQLATASSVSPQASISTHAPVSPRGARCREAGPAVPAHRSPCPTASDVQTLGSPTPRLNRNGICQLASANWHHETRQWLPRACLFNMTHRPER